MKNLTPMPWTADALCAQTDPELFFPERGGSSWEAKRLCRSCPVLEQCRDYAQRHDVHGIWGGQSRNERRHRATGAAA